MIVIDPVITDTAKMADFHLRVRPGTDAWCLAAMAAVLVQEDLCDEAFLAEHVNGADDVRDVLRDVPVGDYAQRCGVDEELLRAAARRIAGADSVAVFEDLGIQQAPNSTLCSYLNKLLWILTGNFAKRGGQHLHSSFAPLFAGGRGRPHAGHRRTDDRRAGPVQRCAAGDPDRPPDRFRAMIVESSNPAHSLADSAACREAFESLELMVVIDVAMTETARLAHYVLPAATQFEKPEATFFNLEFPPQHFSSAPSDCSSRYRAHCPSPRSGRGWFTLSASSTRPSWNPFVTLQTRAATHMRRRSSRPSAPTQRWPDWCHSCFMKRWGQHCPKAFPARQRCGDLPRRRCWPIRRRFVAQATPTVTHCSTRSCRTARG